MAVITDHDKTMIDYTSCNGSHATEQFLNHLLNEDNRINEEHKHDIELKGKYDEVDIMDPENMDNMEIASWQWCHDNPEWYKELRGDI